MSAAPTMTDYLNRTLHRNTLRYAVSRALFCPECKVILDERKAALFEGSGQSMTVGHVACFFRSLGLDRPDRPVIRRLARLWNGIAARYESRGIVGADVTVTTWVGRAEGQTGGDPTITEYRACISSVQPGNRHQQTGGES